MRRGRWPMRKKRSGLRVNPVLRHPASTQATKWFASKATLSAGRVTTAVCPGVLSPWRQDLQDNTDDRLPTYQRWVGPTAVRHPSPSPSLFLRLRRSSSLALRRAADNGADKEAAQARSEYRETSNHALPHGTGGSVTNAGRDRSCGAFAILYGVSAIRGRALPSGCRSPTH